MTTPEDFGVSSARFRALIDALNHMRPILEQQRPWHAILEQQQMSRFLEQMAPMIAIVNQQRDTMELIQRYKLAFQAQQAPCRATGSQTWSIAFS